MGATAQPQRVGEDKAKAHASLHGSSGVPGVLTALDEISLSPCVRDEHRGCLRDRASPRLHFALHKLSRGEIEERN